MPVYFAYGANLDRQAMARRCPASTVLGPGRLMNHRFFIMAEGFASLRREQGAVVHGLLWTLALADIASLDRFEEVAAGLYGKTILPIVKTGGAHRALVYIGRSTAAGMPRPGYLEAIVDAAEGWRFPEAYCRELRGWLPRSSAEGIGHPLVRPRFATPFDR